MSGLARIVLTVLPAWLVHTYLLVVKNEGFSGFGHWSATLLNVPGNGAVSFVAFGAGAAMFWSTFTSVLSRGPAATWGTLVSAPARCFSALKTSAFDNSARLGLALGLAVVCLGVNRCLPPGTPRLLLSVVSLFLTMGYPGVLLCQFLAGRVRRLALFRSLDAAVVVRTAVASVGPAIAASWWLSPWASSRLGWLALFFVGYTLFKAYAPTTPVKTNLLVLLGLGWLFDLWTVPAALADDGGWMEATGSGEMTWSNVLQWWRSPGAGTAISQGLLPALGAAVGAAMVPPLAPPKDGLDLRVDVSQNVKKDDQEYSYKLDVGCQGNTRVPADGRTQVSGYSLGTSNDPKVTAGDLARAAQFSTTAPPGFQLRILREDLTFGGDCKQFTMVAVADPDAAFAPGEIPGVVYAEASSPAGPLRGHQEYTILVGTGKLHVDPLERDWLRADGEDYLQLTAYIEPTDGAEITSQERRSTLELAAYGPNRDWVLVSQPGDGEFYRYWTIQAAKTANPETMRQDIEVELGLQGRFAGGLFQEKIPVHVLPPPRLQAEPIVPFLVPEHQEKVEIRVEVIGRAAKENWDLDSPVFKSGKSAAVHFEGVETQSSGVFQLTFNFGRLPEDVSCAEVSYGLVARESTRGVKTEEFVLRVLAARPGVIILSRTPLEVLADGKKESELLLTVLTWNESRKVVEVDESGLSEVEFELTEENKALEAADLRFVYQESRGSDLGRHAVYKVTTRSPVPGQGFCSGKFHSFWRADSDDDFRRPLPVALKLDAVTLAEQNKDEEWKLILDVLQRYFKGPYENAESSDKAGHLRCLLEIYDRWMTELERDKRYLGSADLRERRRLILKEAVATWKAIGEGYLGDARFYEHLLRAAVTLDWFVDNAFTSCAKAILAWTGPLGATVGSTVVNKTRAYLTRFVGNTLNGIAPGDTWKEIQDDLWGVVRDFTWQDSPEVLAKTVLGTANADGELEVSPRVKAALLTGFVCYRFYRNYVDDDPVTKENPTGFWRASLLTAQDVGMKFAGDAFEGYCKELPLFRGGPKVKDWRPGGGAGAPPAPGGGPPGPGTPPPPAGGGAPPPGPPTP